MAKKKHIQFQQGQNLAIKVPKRKKAPAVSESQLGMANLALSMVKETIERNTTQIKRAIEDRPDWNGRIVVDNPGDFPKTEIDFADVLNALQKIHEKKYPDSLKVENIKDAKTDLSPLEKQLIKLKSTVQELADRNVEVTINPESRKFAITNWPSKPEDALPVTMTDKDQKKFVEMVVEVVNRGGGGGGGSIANVDLSSTNELLQQLIENTDTLELTAENVNLNTDDLEEKLDTIHADLDTVESKLQEIINNTGSVGGATEATLIQVRDYVDTVEAKLQSIIENTDSLEVNTDGVETALAEITTPSDTQPVSGTFWQATQPVSGTVSPQRGTSTATTQVGDSASSLTLLSSNTSRIRAVITNDSTAVLYVKEGTTASATSYTYRLAQYDSVVIDDYTGRIDGIWASDAGGNAYVGETT